MVGTGADAGITPKLKNKRNKAAGIMTGPGGKQ